MGRKSSIVKLPKEIREAVDRAIREERATYDEIKAMVDRMGGSASRTAIADYARKARDQMQTYRQAQEIASVWAKHVGEQPNGDIAQLNLQLLSTLAFKVLSDINERADGSVAPMELMLLAKAVDHFSKADKTNLERELRVRKEMAAAAAECAAAGAKQRGLSAEAADQIRRDILGLAK